MEPSLASQVLTEKQHPQVRGRGRQDTGQGAPTEGTASMHLETRSLLQAGRTYSQEPDYGFFRPWILEVFDKVSVMCWVRDGPGNFAL